MKTTPYAIHYGIGMLMNFEPLAYDTLNFQSGNSVELTKSKKIEETSLRGILKNNKKLAQITNDHLNAFPLFKKVTTIPTDVFQFAIEKHDQPSEHTLTITNLQPSRVLVMLDIAPGAEVTIIENIESSAYVGYELNINAGEGSKVHVISAVASSSLRTILRNAYMAKDSHIVWHEAVIEGLLIQSHTRTYLYETGARAEVKDLFALSGDTVLDMYHSMYHLASHTSSDMLTKGVLDKKSRALYQGLIHIDENAVGCTGYQKQDSLILSDSAEVNAVPNLEIENSDVKCSHGVTTAHIDREKLFYAQSRGINEAVATELFVGGHLSPCLDAISNETIKNEIQERVAKNLMEDRFPA